MKLRIQYLLASLVCIVLGLFSRSTWLEFPDWSDEYVGDVIWATMVYFLTAFLFPYKCFLKILLAITFSFVIEFSQLIQTDWMNQIRHFPGMGLVFGYGFKWSDLLCYLLGVLIGACLDRFAFKH